MAKETDEQARAEFLVSELHGGLEQAQGYLLAELIKIGQASEKKVIDVNDEKVKQAIETLISAEPDNNEDLTKPTKSVLSINATVQDGKKKIAKWIAGTKATKDTPAIPPIEAKYFDAIKKEMDELFSKVEDKWSSKVKDQLSTQEGIDNAIKNRIKNNVILQQIGLFKSNGDQLVPLNATEKNAVVNKIEQNIKIPDSVVSATLQDEKALITPLREMVTKRATECFGEKGKDTDGICIIDEKKLTPENIEKFAELVNHDMKAFSTIQDTFKEIGITDIEQNKKSTQALLPTITKLNPEEMQEKGKEIVKNFAPLLESKNEKLAKSTESALAKLDSGYLSEYSAVIAAELKTVNEKGTSWWEKFKSVFTHTDYLAERLEKVTDNYVLKNDEYVEKEINNKIFLNAVKDTEIATGLTKFIEQNKDKLQGLEIITSKSSKEINSKELAELRKVNPVGFDKALFGQAPSYDKIPPSPSPEVTRGIVQIQEKVASINTPSWQQTVSNREKSQRKEGGREL